MAKTDIATAPNEQQEYKGSGRVSSALGGASLWGIPTFLAAIASSIPIKNATEAANSSTFSEILANNKGKSALAIAGLAALIVAPIYGAVRGWNNSANAKEQFEKQREGLNEAGAMLVAQEKIIEQQKAAIAEAHHELTAERKRFTDTIKPHTVHPHPAHADHASKSHADGIHSRAEHGSHAAASEADKTRTAHTQHGVA